MFDPTAHIARMKPFTDNLLLSLEKKGILCKQDPTANNLIFYNRENTKQVSISHHSFYRFSGIACIYKEHGDHLIETVEVTDKMFLQNFMGPIVELHFPKPKSK
jgi:hypothetical protein